ncbi:putative manganese-dependent inorganic diphosphatase [Persicirhabdus sediminis]|uniref:inorganic diphosphatase n=1 Tax=Persicirhabdus sediminis TaxID=454144 RepID=A0A8J7SJC2_9BACT|nr:putative manganese-dependent inorganic diphosphatase [Persicirhabdus sediminis]MBK1791249.1 putative manganese-dependent inorganic diphosphatase [Persicirhabdus sediminis]
MNEESTPLYVVGHKNPDTDAICAAIGYADLLQQTGYPNAKAIRCGDVPARTAWVLKQAEMEAPKLIEDVHTTAGMMCRRQVIQVSPGDTFLTAYRRMLSSGVRCIPVVDDNNKVLGILRYLDLLQLLMPTELEGQSVRHVTAAPTKIAETLQAQNRSVELSEEEQEFMLLVGASSEDSVEWRLLNAEKEGYLSKLLVVCGDRPSIQEKAIDHGVGMLVVTGCFSVSPELLARAKVNGVAVLTTDRDTASVTKLVRCSRMVRCAMADNLLLTEEQEAVKDFSKKLTKSDQDLYPVVRTGTQQIIGVISKSDLIDPPRIQLVLVDHNEYSQAIYGVREAKVISVIDHHRLAGDLVSRDPIHYLNEPVGSTSTLVAREYRYKNIEMSSGIAKCLLAGIISDTLNLTSPTTSETDREILPWLCEIAGVDANKFMLDFFASGSLLANAEADEVLGTDRKEFLESGCNISISHVEEVGHDLFLKRASELQKYLDEFAKVGKYDLALLIVTDITSHNSLLLAAGDEELIACLPYKEDAKGALLAPGVVSRKKQVFPAVSNAVAMMQRG